MEPPPQPRRVIPDLDWAGRHDLGGAMAVLVDTAGMHYFEHECDREQRLPGNGEIIVSAPALTAHNCLGPLETVTVQPSILCPDCGVHGFVRAGVWAGV